MDNFSVFENKYNKHTERSLIYLKKQTTFAFINNFYFLKLIQTTTNFFDLAKI